MFMFNGYEGLHARIAAVEFTYYIIGSMVLSQVFLDGNHPRFEIHCEVVGGIGVTDCPEDYLTLKQKAPPIIPKVTRLAQLANTVC